MSSVNTSLHVGGATGRQRQVESSGSSLLVTCFGAVTRRGIKIPAFRYRGRVLASRDPGQSRAAARVFTMPVLAGIDGHGLMGEKL